MYYKSLLICFITSYGTLTPSIISNDQEAYHYCTRHPNSYIAIVWPIAQGKDAHIVRILNKYGSIKYRKNIYLSHEQAHYLLKRAHPHITNMHEHVDWYFPPGTFEKLARIFVVSSYNQQHIVLCKHAIRHLFDLQYRSIHINDTHTETIELATFFFTNKQDKTNSGDHNL